MVFLGKRLIVNDLWSKCLLMSIARQHNICFYSLPLSKDKMYFNVESTAASRQRLKISALFLPSKGLMLVNLGSVSVDGVKGHPVTLFIYLCMKKSGLFHRKYCNRLKGYDC